MSHNAFTETAPEILHILAELTVREPIFHRPAHPTVMASDYWEVGASGRRYSRDFILRLFAEQQPVDAASAGWQTFDPQLRHLAPDIFLLTYTLHQDTRRTRRATLWQRTEEGWQVLYHQGTLIAAEEDDTAPPKRAVQS